MPRAPMQLVEALLDAMQCCELVIVQAASLAHPQQCACMKALRTASELTLCQRSPDCSMRGVKTLTPRPFARVWGLERTASERREHTTTESGALLTPGERRRSVTPKGLDPKGLEPVPSYAAHTSSRHRRRPTSACTAARHSELRSSCLRCTSRADK